MRKSLIKTKIFLFPILNYFKIALVGQLALNEIIAFIDLLSITNTIRLYKSIPNLKKITLAYFIFFLFQILSDVINHNTIENSIKGCANILMAIITTTFLTKYFSKSPKFIIIYLLGEMLRFVLWDDNVVNYTEEVSLENMGLFKFRIIPILNSLILILFYYLRLRNFSLKYSILLLLAYALFCLTFDARSNGIFCLLTSIILLNKNSLIKWNYRTIIVAASMFLISCQGLYILYVSQVLQGNIGGEHSRQQLQRTKNPYNPIYLLASGRAETMVAITAISDKPIWGHGSWPPDYTGKYNYMVYKLHDEEEKYDAQMKILEKAQIIPSHSVILGAWVTAGFIGFLAVMYIFVLFVSTFFAILKDKNLNNSPFIHIAIFFFLDGLWTFLFSPLAQIKLTLPLIISIMIVMSNVIIVPKKIKEKLVIY